MRSIYKRQRGSLPLAALILPAIIGVVALILFSSLAPSGVTKVHSLANHLALIAIKEYSYHDCETPNVISSCHSEKVEHALIAVRGLAERNSSVLIDTDILLTQSPGSLYLEPLRYYHVATDTSGCASYPCLEALNSGEMATAMRITGTVSSNKSSMLSLVTNIFGANTDITLDISSAAQIMPMDIALLIDYSPSVAEGTYLSPKGVPDPPNAGDPTSSYFAYEVHDPESDGTYESISTLSGTNWDGLVVTRPDGDTRGDPYHFQSDYTQEVWSFGYGLNHWTDYGSTFNKYHPKPIEGTTFNGLSPNIQFADSTDPSYHWIDGYGTVTPEPFTSILVSSQAIIEKLKARQVPQDYLSMIFYSHVLKWSAVINMTNDLSYIEGLINSSVTAGSMNPLISRSDFDSSPLYSDDYRQPNNPNIPLIYRLGVFPTSEGFTDQLKAYYEAAYQFRSIPGDRLSQKAVIDITDGFIGCTDEQPSNTFPNCTGLPENFQENCCFRPVSTKQCCRASYDVYAAGDADIDRWIADNFFKAGISLNVAQFGQVGGPHYVLYPSYDNPGTCMDQTEARSLGIDYVQGEQINTQAHGRGLFNYRYNIPFYQAAYDSYKRAETTRGLYVPILQYNGGDCDAIPDCSINGGGANGGGAPTSGGSASGGGDINGGGDDSDGGDTSYFGTRQTESCKTTTEQLEDGFRDILDNNTSFSLIDPNL